MSKFKELLQSDKPTLVDFFADWCAPCKTMAPILDDFKKQIGAKVTVLKVNVDKNQHAAQVYKVQSIPTLILFKNGKILWRQAGVVSKNDLIKVMKEKCGV